MVNTCWFADVYGKEIERAPARLPADVVAAAEERGRAQTLRPAVEEIMSDTVDPQLG